jgi:hypothetical protein
MGICTDDDPCTIDSCDPNTGGCHHVQKDCDDEDACTVDTCVAGECVHETRKCEDGNPCTVDSCDPQTGYCRFERRSCSDGNMCTLDFCDFSDGMCSHVFYVCGRYEGPDSCRYLACDPQNGQCREYLNSTCEGESDDDDYERPGRRLSYEQTRGLHSRRDEHHTVAHHAQLEMEKTNGYLNLMIVLAVTAVVAILVVIIVYTMRRRLGY